MKKILALLATAILSINVAFAAPITGRIDFTGSGAAVTSGGTLLTTTGLTFNNPVSAVIATGSFAGITTGTFNSFSLASVSMATPVQLWTAGTFTFDMSSITNAYNTASTIVLTGYGTIMNSGANATSGTFNITANSGGGNVFSFSSTTVPEPGPIALLGLGLLGLGAARLKARKS